MDYIGPFTFNAIRSFIGGLALLPVIVLFSPKKREKTKNTGVIDDGKKLWIGGILCGVILFLASSFQQIGIQYTSVGKAGFITACYIVIVAVLGFLFKKKSGPFIPLAVLIAVVGLYLLCIKENFSIEKGDSLILVCSFLFAIHILVIDHFSPIVDCIKMSCIQTFICGILSLIPMFIWETPKTASILQAGVAILYAGILSSGVAYTLQIAGQKKMNPTVASLILSLESCFSVLAGWIILGQQLTGREITGCAVMFIAILLAQLPQKSISLFSSSPIDKQGYGHD